MAATLDVSIHAPAWGATGQVQTMRDKLLVFQSTHPRGVRPQFAGRSSRYVLVSIHAPAWGATLMLSPLLLSVLRFNPRTRVGCDFWWPEFC